MNKTIKVIDLLNKIANGEKVPDKIRYNSIIYNWDIKGYLHYEDEHYSERAFLEGYRTDMVLNDEVEIIEEQEEIDIQSIEDIKDVFIENSTCGEDVKYLARKYNEILKWAKQLDKK